MRPFAAYEADAQDQAAKPTGKECVSVGRLVFCAAPLRRGQRAMRFFMRGAETSRGAAVAYFNTLQQEQV